MKRTFQPKVLKRKRKIGFLYRSSYKGGRKILKRQRKYN